MHRIRTILIALGLLAVASIAFAQTTTTIKRTDAKLPPTHALAADSPNTPPPSSSFSVGVSIFVDGRGKVSTGVAVPVYKIIGTPLKIVSVTTVNITPTSNPAGGATATSGSVYTGVGLQYEVFHTASGMSLQVIAGLKGLSLNNGFQMDPGAGSLFAGASWNIPLGSPKQHDICSRRRDSYE